MVRKKSCLWRFSSYARRRKKVEGTQTGPVYSVVDKRRLIPEKHETIYEGKWKEEERKRR